MNKEERLERARQEIKRDKSGYMPRSPLGNAISGILFGVFIYFIGSRDVADATRAGIGFGLFMNFIDYCYVYYFMKKKEINHG